MAGAPRFLSSNLQELPLLIGSIHDDTFAISRSRVRMVESASILR